MGFISDLRMLQVMQRLKILLLLSAFFWLPQTLAQKKGKLRPLTKDDFRRARTLDIKKDLVDLYPGTGGPMESEKNKKLDRNINHVKPSLPWPSGVIPYTTSSGFSTNEYASIAKAIAYIESETCLKFQQTNYYSKKPRIDIISKN